MNNKKLGLATFAVSLLTAPAAFAWPVNVSVGASTLGFGVQVATALIPSTLDAAVGLNRFNYNRGGIYTSNGDDIHIAGTCAFRRSRSCWTTTRFMGFSASRAA